MEPVTLTVSRYLPAHLEDIRATLLDVYAEVYAAEAASNPYFSLARFARRLEGHTAAPGWECVVGDVDGEPVGYVYGFTMRNDPDMFALCELMVRAPWRGTGTARTLHDELLARRTEQICDLLVEHEHSKVRALYESWGYHYVGSKRTFDDGPLYDELVRDVRRPGEPPDAAV